jgi:hypothetical protein
MKDYDKASDSTSTKENKADDDKKEDKDTA